MLMFAKIAKIKERAKVTAHKIRKAPRAFTEMLSYMYARHEY